MECADSWPSPSLRPSDTSILRSTFAKVHRNHVPEARSKIYACHLLIRNGEVFKKHDLAFSQRPRLTCTDPLVTTKEGFAFQSNTPTWQTLHKIFVHEMLCPKRLQQTRQLRAEEITHMLKAILRDVSARPNTPAELNPKLSLLTANFISQMILSKRYFSHDGDEETAEAKEFKYVNAEMVKFLGSIFPADCLPFLYWFDIGGLQKRTKALYPRFQAILTGILKERRNQRKAEGDSLADKDLVDVLLSHEEKEGDQAINELNIRGIVWDAFAGGTDTQVVTTEWAMAHLVQNPNLIQELQSQFATNDNSVVCAQ